MTNLRDKKRASFRHFRLEELDGRCLLSLTPTVLSFAPAGPTNASVQVSQGIPVGANFSAAFNEPLDPRTVSASSVSLRDQEGMIVPVNVSYNSVSSKATITPSVVLAGSEAFTVTIKGGPNGVKGADGTPISQDFTSSFTTAPDNTSPLSLWNAAAPAGLSTGGYVSPVDESVSMRSDSPGFLNSIRVYKGWFNADTLVGKLWSSSGVVLATTQPSAVSQGTGWETLDFNSPVAISAGSFRVGFNSKSGNVSFTPQGLSSGADSGPLHIPRAAASTMRTAER